MVKQKKQCNVINPIEMLRSLQDMQIWQPISIKPLLTGRTEVIVMNVKTGEVKRQNV